MTTAVPGRNLLALLAALAVAACGPRASTGPDGGPEADGGGPPPVCAAGATEACYSGQAGTQGVGPCTGGTRTCTDAGQWGPCAGEVVPVAEVCANGIDENCSGTADEDLDQDGDGYTTCGGDCCDADGAGCATAVLVNPGAYEAPGNTVDDDCDGMVDNVVAATCDAALTSNPADPLAYAQAMDLCQTATLTDDRWGVISARLTLPSGTGTPDAGQHAVRPAFGATTVRAGAAFAVLSTGSAAAPTQTSPDHVDFQQAGPRSGTTSAFPADWLAANGGQVPNAPGCPDPIGTEAFDPVMLELTIRTPSNARSFRFSTNFLSSEFPEWTCSPYNDFYVVLLDSAWAGTPANPADKNLATYSPAAGVVYPVGVNLAYGDTGLFQQCVNGATGCTAEGVDGTISTCAGVAELAGTGMDGANPPPNAVVGGAPGSCGASNLAGGGTGWLTTSGNVVGGEVITLRIALWDTSDGIYDSVAIIDAFEWSVEASQPGTVIQ